MRKIYLIASMDKDTIIDPDATYKIGITKQEKDKRLKQLSTGTDKTLKIIKEFKSEYPFKVEMSLHNYFKNKKINKEWFKLDKYDVYIFIDLCYKYENVFKILDKNNNPYL